MAKQAQLSAALREANVQPSSATLIIPVLFHIVFANPSSSAAVANTVAWSLAKLNADFNGLCPEQAQYDSVFGDQAELQTTYLEYKARIGCASIQFISATPAYKFADKPLPLLNTLNIGTLDVRIKDANPPVSPERVLNVWVASLGGGLLGYAQFPWESPSRYDGVVITREVFGPDGPYPEYRQNKTLSHEVGHWLGLYHVFQDTFKYDGGNVDYAPGENAEEVKGDCVIDTPPQGEPVFGNPFTSSPPSWPITQKPSDQTQSYRCMFMNFMDYTDDPARFMFTRDQAVKMRLMTTMYRPSLGTPPPSLELGFPNAAALKTWTVSTNVTWDKGAAWMRATSRMSKTVSTTGSCTLVVTYNSTSTTALLTITRSGVTLGTAPLSPGTTSRTLRFTATGPFLLLITNSKTKDVRVFKVTVQT